MDSDLQVLADTTSHRRPSRTLYHAGFTADLRERVVEHIGQEDIAAHYGFLSRVGLRMERPAHVPPPDYSKYWESEDLPAGTTINEWGVAQQPSGFYHFWGYISPLRNATSLADIENYPLDDMSDWDTSSMREIVREGHALGRIVAGGIGHTYETAWQIRGYPEFLTDLIERPAWAECLLERLAEQNRQKARAFAEAGADWYHCGDDIANQRAMTFAPELWRRVLLSRWRSVWEIVKEIRPQGLIWYHSDGNIAQVVPDLIEAGVDILNPVQPECLDLDKLHRRYGQRLTFDGAIGTQSTMPWGTPQDVRDRVKYVIETYGQAGGLIVSPTHVLEPEVPIANIDAFAEACRDYGTFG